MKNKKSTIGERMNSGGVVIISTPKEPETKQPKKATTSKPKK